MSSTITALTSGGGLAMAGDTSGQLELKTNNGTTAVTVDTSQNVLVGTTTSTNNIRLNEKIAVVTAGNGTFGGISNTSYNGTSAGTAPLFDFQRSRGITDGSMTAVASGDTIGYLAYRGSDGTGFIDSSLIIGDCDGTVATNQVPGRLVFKTANSSGTMTERMRINSAGNMSVGTTSDIARIGAVFDGNSNNGCVLRTSTNASGAGFLYFQQDTNTCGSVTRVGTTSAVTYASTSDYRLKENVVPMTDGLDKVARLKPVTYTWKQGGESAEGFIAHELAEVCPDAVVGTKDQMETYLDDEGNEQTRPKYQSIDTSFLVATLTAAIQELNAKVDAQAAEIAALKGAQ